MTSRFLLLATAIGPFIAAVACSAPKDDWAESGTSDLIGGRVAIESEFPSTMLVKGNCTVSKVGPRHILTAAHCVTGGSASKFVAGATIQVTPVKATGAFVDAGADSGADAGAAAPGPWRDAVIETTEVQPNWAEKCAQMTCLSVNISGRNDIADVAVIVVRDEQALAGIPEVAVDLSPVAPGDRVAITGYGCEGAVGGNWNYANQRLRVAETEAIPFDRVIHAGSFIYPEDRDTGLATTMSGHYVITPGPTDPNAPDGGDVEGRGGLCPGDSGGPLYRLGEAEPVVVGVNANYTFITGGEHDMGDGSGRKFNYGGSPVTNWHTRLDGQNGHHVGAWLRGLGARTACTRGGCE